MNIGIPNEILVEERRITLTLVGVYALTNEGHTVYVEKGAGKSCGFPDLAFQEVGAQVVFSSDEVYHRSELVAKVKSTTESECDALNAGKVMLSFLGLGAALRPSFLHGSGIRGEVRG